MSKLPSKSQRKEIAKYRRSIFSRNANRPPFYDELDPSYRQLAETLERGFQARTDPRILRQSQIARESAPSVEPFIRNWELVQGLLDRRLSERRTELDSVRLSQAENRRRLQNTFNAMANKLIWKSRTCPDEDRCVQHSAADWARGRNTYPIINALISDNISEQDKISLINLGTTPLVKSILEEVMEYNNGINDKDGFMTTNDEFKSIVDLVLKADVPVLKLLPQIDVNNIDRKNYLRHMYHKKIWAEKQALKSLTSNFPTYFPSMLVSKNVKPFVFSMTKPKKGKAKKKSVSRRKSKKLSKK